MFGTSQLDDELVAQAASGCGDALARLLEAIAPQVRLMVAARLSPAPARMHAAEELTQLALVALSSGLSRLERPTVDGLRAYLSGIVSRKVADHIRQRGEGDLTGPRPASLETTVGDAAPGPLWALLSAGGTSPRTAAERAEQLERLFVEIGSLSERHRQAVTLAFFDQMTTAQIAGRLEISRPAASMLVLRAVSALRQRLGGSAEAQGSGER